MVYIEISLYIPWISMVYIEIYIYIYVYIYHVQETEKQQKRHEKSMNFCFMLDGRKVYKSSLVYPFGILMG